MPLWITDYSHGTHSKDECEGGGKGAVFFIQLNNTQCKRQTMFSLISMSKHNYALQRWNEIRAARLFWQIHDSISASHDEWPKWICNSFDMLDRRHLPLCITLAIHDMLNKNKWKMHYHHEALQHCVHTHHISHFTLCCVRGHNFVMDTSVVGDNFCFNFVCAWCF